MTSQEIFDFACNHLRTQKVRCADDTTCLYRDGLGHKCVVGAFIPDRDYDPKMEGNTLRVLLVYTLLPEHLISLFKANLELFSSLQVVHDGGEAWEAGLQSCAQKYNLVYTPPPHPSPEPVSP
jgi:hypothetical protein